jgi:hypothetical protein
VLFDLFERQKIGPTIFSLKLGLLGSPLGDSGMIAAKEDLRNNISLEITGPRVLREFENAITAGKGVVPRTKFIAQDAGYHSNRCVNHNHRGNFAPVKDKISDAQFHWLKDIEHPLVKTLVTSTQQDQSGHLPELLDDRLNEPIALGCEQNYLPRSLIELLYIPNAVDNWVHHDEHTWPTTEWSIVNFMMLRIGRPLSEIVNTYFHESLLNCFVQ